MNCIYLRKRFKKYQPYFYCKYQGNEIILSACQNCSNRILKENKPISKISSNRRKLEKNRYSILNNLDYCYFCGKKAECIHEVYFGKNRNISIKNGFCVGLCNEHHNLSKDSVHFNKKKDLELKKLYQEEYEKNKNRESFIKLIGRSYL